MLSLDSVFPMLKSSIWADNAGRTALIIESLPQNEDGPTIGAPVLTFCADRGESVSIIQSSDLTPEITLQRIERAALQNLEYALSDIGWDEVDMNEHVAGMKVLILGGNFYASEALLLPNRMMQAHRRLGSRRILACVPSRGRLLVTDAVEENSEHVGVFIAGCLSEFYSMEDDAPISPIVWVVEEGEIVGHLDVPPEVSEKIADQSRVKKAPTGEEVEVAQYEVEDADGIRLRMVFEGTDPDVILDAFDNVMRETIDQVVDQAIFNGQIQASIVMGHGHDIDRDRLIVNIAEKVEELKKFILDEKLISASLKSIQIAAHVVDSTADLQQFPKSEAVPDEPEHIGKSSVVSRVVFQPNQVAVAALFGTPVAGLLMLAFNYKNCGNMMLAQRCLIGAVAMIPLFALLLSVLHSSGFLLFSMLSMAGGLWYVCRSFPGVDFKKIPQHTVKTPASFHVAGVAALSISVVILNYAVIHSLF